MSYQGANLNNANSWEKARREDKSRVEVDLHEVEAVIEQLEIKVLPVEVNNNLQRVEHASGR